MTKGPSLHAEIESVFDTDVTAIRRSSTADQAAHALREKITSGAFEPGTPLPEAALTESLGVSRNTVREALRILAREGLVEHNMHRGAAVAVLDEEDIADIFRVRRMIEAAAVEAGVETDRERLEPLRQAAERMVAAADAGDANGVVSADVAFHGALVSLLGSSRLNRFFEGMQGELWLCLAMVARSESESKALAAEHVQLCEMLENGEPAQRSRERLLEHLGPCQSELTDIARELGERRARLTNPS
ncbi:MAG TPA: GntR family transcriptional regulator [Solirubrobacterales bacterium]|nr:GntR family transcriptional regulator [Solirubrobacterales bacterium]